MMRLKSILAGIVYMIVAIVAVGYAGAADLKWIAPAGGNWSDGANWDAAAPPGATDNALITLDGTYTVTLDVDATFVSLTLGGSSGEQTLDVPDGQTLTLNGASTVEPNGFVILAGTLSGSGDLTVEGTLDWMEGAMTGTGSTIIASGGTLDFDGCEPTRVLGRELDLHGFASLAETFCGGDLVMEDGANLEICLSGLWDWIPSPLTPFNIVDGGGTNSFVNQGTITKSGTGTVAIGVPFTNTPTGIVTIANGALKIGDGSNAGTMDVTGGQLRFFEPSPTTTPPSYLNSGIINVIGGDVYQEMPPFPSPPPTFTNTGTIIVDAGRSLNINYGTFHQQSGTLNRAGDVIVATRCEWDGGLMSGAGQTIIEPSGSLVVCGGGQNLWWYGLLENQGLVEIGGCVAQPGSLAMYDATILNQPGGIIDCDPPADFSVTDAAGTNSIVNHGTITKSGTGTVVIGVPFTNTATGIVTLADGPLKLGAGSNVGTIDVYGGNLSFFEPGSTTTPTFTNSGIIHLVGGDLHQEMPPIPPPLPPTFTNTGSIIVDAGRSLNVDYGTFSQEAGELNRSGDVNVAATFEWTGGLMSGAGNTLIQPPGSLFLCGAGQNLWLYGAIENQGLVEIGACVDQPGSLAMYNATILNQPGGIIAVAPLADFIVTDTAGDNAITNLGMINKLGSASFTTTVPFNNNSTGMVTITGDELRVNGGGTNDGQIDVVNETQTGILTFAGGSYTHAAGSSITGDGPVQFLGGTHNLAGALDTTGSFTVQFAHVNLNANYTFPSPVTLGGSSNADTSLGGSGDVIFEDSFTWTAGTLDGTGKTIIAPGCTFTKSGANGGQLSRTLELWTSNSNWTSSGIQVNNGTFHIMPGGVLNVNFASDSGFHGPGAGPNTFINDGTVHKSGAGRMYIGLGNQFVVLTNTGDIQLHQDELAINGGGTSSGQIHADAGTTLTFAKAFTNEPASSLTGPGLMRFVGAPGPYELSGAMETDRTIRFQAGMVNLNVPYTFDGTLELNGSGNLLAGAADASIAGTLDWKGGGMAGTGRTTILPGAVMALTETQTKTLSRVLDNQSASASWMSGGFLTLNNGTLNNLPGAVLTVGGSVNQTVFNGGGVNAFNNSGTLNKVWKGVTELRTPIPFNNSGDLNITSGEFQVQGEFTQTAGQTLLDGGSLRKALGNPLLLKGGVLGGTGTVIGSVNNMSGILAAGQSPGALTVTGNYIQEAMGTLEVELGGLTPGTEYDVLSVGGTATLAGTLDVSLIDGFIPGDGDMFDIISYGARVGAFATVNLPCGPSGACAPPVGLALDYEPAGVTLAAAAPMPADLDGDGDVDESDLSLFIDVLLGLDTNPWRIAASDVNGSGEPDGLDVQGFVESYLMN